MVSTFDFMPPVMSGEVEAVTAFSNSFLDEGDIAGITFPLG